MIGSLVVHYIGLGGHIVDHKSLNGGFFFNEKACDLQGLFE